MRTGSETPNQTRAHIQDRKDDLQNGQLDERYPEAEEENARAGDERVRKAA